MKLKVIKVAFEENQEIDMFKYINVNQYEITNSYSQIIIENNVSYLYVTIYYKPSLYVELQKAETHKENLKQEIYTLIKEKYPTHSKIHDRLQDIANNYKKIKTIYDFKVLRSVGNTTIIKYEPILEDVLQIINKYNLED